MHLQNILEKIKEVNKNQVMNYNNRKYIRNINIFTDDS